MQFITIEGKKYSINIRDLSLQKTQSEYLTYGFSLSFDVFYEEAVSPIFLPSEAASIIFSGSQYKDRSLESVILSGGTNSILQ